MLPYQVDLLQKAAMLLFAMIASAGVAAYAFRRVWSWAFVIGSFVAAIALIFVMAAVGPTNNPFLIFPVVMLFGAAIGATLGSFTIAVTDGSEHATEAVAITLGIIALITLVTGALGLFSGFNFQSWGGVLFALLLGALAISIIGLFVRWGKVTEVLVGLGISLFFVVYMIYDFNKVVHLYSQSSWSAAMDIATNLFLDMVNIFVRLLPLIVQLLDALD